MARDIEAERAAIEARIDGATLCTEFARIVAQNPDMDAIRWREVDGRFSGMTYAAYADRIRLFALGLRALGFAAGEFAVTLASNRPEHFIADFAILHAGGTSVGLYETLAPEQIAYAAGHCDATVAVVENEAQLEKLLKVRGDLPQLRIIVTMEETGAADTVGFDEVIERGRAADASMFDAMWRAVEPDDVATLIYTSGTTGPPKAVMLSHRNILFHWQTFLDMEIRYTPGERLISYLPLAHVAGHVGAVYGMLGAATVYTCPDFTQLLPHLVEAHPSVFIGVPRVYEKLYAGINAALATQPEELRSAVESAIATGREWVAHRQKGVEPSEELRARWEAAAPVCKAVRGRVGLDECWVALVGAAPIAVEVIEFFHALGLPMLEVWGMSELTAVATANPLDAIRIGSVGVAMPGAEVRLAQDGEILVRSAIRMSGYYKDRAKTAEAIDAEGWMHTGDVGRVDEDGYWYIVDRKKELIITAGGKNISPANLENALKHHPLIGQAAVIGDRRPYLTALVVLDPEVAPAWAQQRGIPATNIVELATDPDVHAEIERAVAEANSRVSRVENIRKFSILPAEWTAESDELTPTLKLKRRVINDKYADVIEQLYKS